MLVAGGVIPLALHWRWIVCMARCYAHNTVEHSGGSGKETCPVHELRPGRVLPTQKEG